MKKIIQAIRQMKSAVILPHINADGDCLGSAEAMRRLLLRLGIPAFVCLDKTPPPNLAFLCEEALIYDENASLPAFDGCICVDCGDLSRTGERRALFEQATHTVSIDHHVTNLGFAKENMVDGDASSTGELISRLYLAMDEPFGESADYLFAAIFTDTGGFRYSNTSPQTLRLAADLVEAGADPAVITAKIYDAEPFEKLRLTAKAIDSVELYHDGRLAVIAIPEDVLSSYHAPDGATDSFSALAKSIEGVLIGAYIKPVADGFKISLRSVKGVDVSKIAQSFGGGGHICASGYSFSGTLEEAKAALVEKVDFSC